MAPKIRSDLEGYVLAHRGNGLQGATPLKAGDDVPDDTIVGDHLLAPDDDALGDSDGGSANSPDASATGTTPAGAVPTKPTTNSSKAEWLAWAEHLELDVDDKTTKDALRGAVAAFEAAASNDDPGAQGAQPAPSPDPASTATNDDPATPAAS